MGKRTGGGDAPNFVFTRKETECFVRDIEAQKRAPAQPIRLSPYEHFLHSIHAIKLVQHNGQWKVIVCVYKERHMLDYLDKFMNDYLQPTTQPSFAFLTQPSGTDEKGNKNKTLRGLFMPRMYFDELRKYLNMR